MGRDFTVTTRSFEELVDEAEHADVAGWDFSGLDGRAFEQRPSWRYFDQVAERASRVESLLDLEVGTGSMIGALPVVPALTVGTEGYPPNLPVAAHRLRDRGAHLFCTGGQHGPIPIRTATFELVTSRHPIDNAWSEIARVLRPGGRYFSQQVGPHSLRELSEFLMGPLPPGSKRDPEVVRNAARQAGLVVTNLQFERPVTEFYDIGAVIYFLRLVVWIVPGFTVATYRDRLKELHRQIERDGLFRTTASRFLIEAHKP